MSSTEKGYINENNQKNIGKTDKKGTGNFQWFYDMECLNCGNKYYANGCGNVLIVKVESLDGIRGIFSFRSV